MRVGGKTCSCIGRKARAIILNLPLGSFNVNDHHLPCRSLLLLTLATVWRSDSHPSAMPKAQTKVFFFSVHLWVFPLSYVFIGHMTTNSIALLAIVQGNGPRN